MSKTVGVFVILAVVCAATVLRAGEPQLSMMEASILDTHSKAEWFLGLHTKITFLAW